MGELSFAVDLCSSSSVSGKKHCDDVNNRIILCDVVDCLLRTSER